MTCWRNLSAGRNNRNSSMPMIGGWVMWDNTQVMHRRNAFDPNVRRLLKRTGWELLDALAIPF